MTVTECGCFGHDQHFNTSRWYRHTQIDNWKTGQHYRISTIGDFYVPREAHQTVATERVALGPDDRQFYWSLVHRTNANPSNENSCGCKAIFDRAQLDSRYYETAAQAQQGHEELIRIFVNRANGM